MRILVINCGSTSLKYKLYAAQEQGLSLLAAASVPLKPGEEAPITGGDRFTTAVAEALVIRWRLMPRYRGCLGGFREDAPVSSRT